MTRETSGVFFCLALAFNVWMGGGFFEPLGETIAQAIPAWLVQYRTKTPARHDVTLVLALLSAAFRSYGSS